MPTHGFTTDSSRLPTFEGNFASGADVGASVCVRIGDETVVDLWGGTCDTAGTKPWVRDTIVNVYSTTKTMTALTALLLADRGLIDFKAPVAKYWPVRRRGKGAWSPHHEPQLRSPAGATPTKQDLTTGSAPSNASPRRNRSGSRAPRPAITP